MCRHHVCLNIACPPENWTCGLRVKHRCKWGPWLQSSKSFPSSKTTHSKWLHPPFLPYLLHVLAKFLCCHIPPYEGFVSSPNDSPAKEKEAGNHLRKIFRYSILGSLSTKRYERSVASKSVTFRCRLLLEVAKFPIYCQWKQHTQRYINDYVSLCNRVCRPSSDQHKDGRNLHPLPCEGRVLSHMYMATI